MNTKIVAIGAVAIIAIAAVAIAFNVSNDGKDDGEISIVDGSGRTITLSEPLTNVCVINSNVPKAMIMLGIDDMISCYHYSKTLGIKAESDSNAKLGTYYTPSIETLLEYRVQAVICPVASMTLYASTEKSCEDNGISVIRLDCNGDSLFEDLNKLSTVFGEPQSAKTALSTYSGDYEAVVDAVKNAVSGKTPIDYLATVQMNAGGISGSIYNVNSAIAKLYNGVFGKNVTSYTNLSTNSVTNPVNSGSIEAVSDVMDKVGAFIMRCDLSKGESAGDNLYTNYVKNSSTALVTSGSPAYQNNRIFVVNSDIMSGIYGHIGLLLVASLAYGVTVDGYEDIDSMISEFQKKYGQSAIEDGEILAMTYGKDYGTDGNLVVKYTEPHN